jgi:hypothetical protein
VSVETECILGPGEIEDKTRIEGRFKSFLEFHGLPERISFSFFKQLYERFPVQPWRKTENNQRAQKVSGIGLKASTDCQG